MNVTTKLTDKQLRQVHNLMLNCRDKQDMFDHLITIGLSAFHALHMSNSFDSLCRRDNITVAFTVLPIVSGIKPRTYEANEYKPGKLK